MNAVGTASPEVAARRILLRDLARDGITPAELRAASDRAMGKPEMLADLAGENVLQAAQVVARTPGPGRQIASENLRARIGPEQAQRLTEDIRRHVSGEDFRTEWGAMLEQRSQEARPLYEAAWNIRVPGTITKALEPAIHAAYESLGANRAVMAFGACSISGGPYWDSYSVLPGAPIPVDVCVPGCPPPPEVLAEGFRQLRAVLVQRGVA